MPLLSHIEISASRGFSTCERNWRQVIGVDPTEIGRRIRIAREERGLKQVDLAPLVGYAANTISQWETGKRRISFDDLLRIAQALGKPLQYFLGLDFAGADMGRATELMEEAKRRLEDLMVQAAQPGLPGLLGEIVEAAKRLPEDKQHQVLEYARLLVGAIQGTAQNEDAAGSSSGDPQGAGPEKPLTDEEIERERGVRIAELRRMGFGVGYTDMPPGYIGDSLHATAQEPDYMVGRVDGRTVIVEVKGRSGDADAVVRSLAKAKRQYRAAMAVVAAPAFTAQAETLAKHLGVRLMSYAELTRWVHEEMAPHASPNGVGSGGGGARR